EISCIPQQARQRRAFLDEPGELFASFAEDRGSIKLLRLHAFRHVRIVANHFVFMWISPCEDRSQTGSADAGRHIASGEQPGFPREPIQIRRLNMWMSHEAVIGPCMIIRNDEDDVGWPICG